MTVLFDPINKSQLIPMLFGACIVLDLRICLIRELPPYYFCPSREAQLHCFPLLLYALPDHFKHQKSFDTDMPRRFASLLDDDEDVSFDQPGPLKYRAVKDNQLEKELTVVHALREKNEQLVVENSLHENPMARWNANKEMFPLLYPLAAYFLSIPLGSVEVEKFLSRMRGRTDYRQSNINPQTMENRALVADNIDLMRPKLQMTALTYNVVEINVDD